jgi:membrane associated rhomboid family serine protease
MNDVDRGTRPSAEDIRRRLANDLGLPSRLRYVALLVAGAVMAAAAGSLAATEPGLPTRTRVALAVVALGGVAWAVLAGWVLRRRRVLFATHRVAAGILAIVMSALFTAGAVALGLTGAVPSAGAFAAAATGGGMMALAAIAWLAGRRRVGMLRTRREELERLLGEGG